MKTLILSFGLIIAFSACGKQEETPLQELAPQTIHKGESQLLKSISNTRDSEEKAEKSASFILKKEKTEGETVTVLLSVENPKAKEITSVRARISYPKDILTVESVEQVGPQNFPVIAPGELNANQEEGTLIIGVSTAEGNTISQTTIPVARVTFTQKSNSLASLDFYQAGDDDGSMILEKTNENIFQDILLSPASPALLLSLSQ